MKIMDATVLFDNRCYLCTKFARMVNFFARGKIAMVGHYSELGENIREEILDETALEMFWFIDKKRAYGGRAALIPLARAVISVKTKKRHTINTDAGCLQDCKSVKSVFLRSASLITSSRIIELSK